MFKKEIDSLRTSRPRAISIYRTLCPIDKLLEKVVISKIRYHIQHEKKFLKQDDFSEKRYHIVDVAPHPSCM